MSSYSKKRNSFYNKDKSLIFKGITIENHFWKRKIDFNGKEKLIISDHGVTATKHNNFSHEDKISDLHVVWHRALNARQVQMPPNILANRSKKRGSENNLAIIKYESYREFVRIEGRGQLTIKKYFPSLSKQICPFYPFKKTDDDNGIEIRIQIRKKYIS